MLMHAVVGESMSALHLLMFFSSPSLQKLLTNLVYSWIANVSVNYDNFLVPLVLLEIQMEN